MKIDSKVSDIISKVNDGSFLTRDEIVFLLEINPHSADAGLVLASADAINRAVSGNKAEVHAQIGVNLSPCPKNCSFCAFASKNRVFKEKNELSVDEITEMALRATLLSNLIDSYCQECYPIFLILMCHHLVPSAVTTAEDVILAKLEW